MEGGGIFEPDSECIMDDIIERNDDEIVLYQVPRDIKLHEEVYPGGQRGSRKYEYDSLLHPRDIRLLECYPTAADSNEITFGLEMVSLDDVPRGFVALSYRWDGEPTQSLLLSNGAELKVTNTAFNFLRHVAGISSGLLVWMDAICINQDDTKEKSVQVAMMRDIYAAAKCVVVWLGNGNSTQEEWDLCRFLSSLLDTSTGTFYLNSIGVGGDGDMQCSRMLGSSWFERVWVVQEVCFAKKVCFLYGMVGMSLPFLRNFLEARHKHYESLPATYLVPSGFGYDRLPVFQRFRRLCAHRNLIQQNGGRPLATLTDVLIEFQPCKATEEKDKVFALLGLGGYHDLQPDYTMSIGETFTEAMIACSTSLGYDYRILGFAGLANLRSHEATGSSGSAKVPTWVPDFSATFSPEPFAIRAAFKATPERDFEDWARSPDKTACIIMRPIANLSIKAALVDTIEYLSVPGFLSGSNSTPSLQEAVGSWLDVGGEVMGMSERLGRYPACNRASTILQTMTTGLLDQFPSITEAKKISVLDAFQKSSSASQYSIQAEEDGAIEEFYSLINVSGVGISRRLFITRNGYLGVANNGIMKGDRVCFMFGAPVPFILRGPVATFPSCEVYNLVCDAYIHGIMNGELAQIQFETMLLE